MSFQVSATPLSGLKKINRQLHYDERGLFSKIFGADELKEAGWSDGVAQVNCSHTSLKGSIRGLHYQFGDWSEYKLVSCIRGAVWDVAVDIRQHSPTFLQWYGCELSEENGFALLVPKGFAHGFQTLVDDSTLIYCHSVRYVKSAERGISPFDPSLAINWPLDSTVISDRDRNFPVISDDFKGELF